MMQPGVIVRHYGEAVEKPNLHVDYAGRKPPDVTPPSLRRIRPYNEEGLPQVLQVQRRGEEGRLPRIRGCPLRRSASCCAPISDESHDTLCALALSTVFQEAADAGAEAFAEAVSQHGPPAVLVAGGGETGGLDIPAYGFAVAPSLQQHPECDEGVLQELWAVGDRRSDALGERVGLSYTHASFIPFDAGEQVPAGGAAALAAAVPAPAIPAAQTAAVSSPPPRLEGGAQPVTATSHTGGEFPGTVSALHAASADGGDLGYDSDDWSQDSVTGECYNKQTAIYDEQETTSALTGVGAAAAGGNIPLVGASDPL
ncbi:hypothetical protein CYMTET_15596 [Cymbomonas tetramitiformis]|uniref:Uncharacterized protein n=1 Tax=Cymbomonas tetramitiformis TaxID=36881 RepID=A0AAE0GF66_9CHLO|nr:hypothetical protein CYMTET_15596 [Cymbomonas tetramitiformis]